jgi:DNA-binding NarL/FixJ family response regulator
MDEITVLLIEDSPTDIELIKWSLQEENKFTFSFHEADSVEAALKLIPHYQFDAVLLDLNLPDSEGLETLRTIILHLPDTAVIVLTGLKDDTLAIQAVRYGAQDFFEKSELSAPYLSKSIRYSIERKKVIQEKKDLFDDLNQALHKIELLESHLPICLGCKKILAGDHQWYALEELPPLSFFKEQKNLICPECRKFINQ